MSRTVYMDGGLDIILAFLGLLKGEIEEIELKKKCLFQVPSLGDS